MQSAHAAMKRFASKSAETQALILYLLQRVGAVIGGKQLQLLEATLIFRFGDFAGRTGRTQCRQPRFLGGGLLIAHLCTCRGALAFDHRIDVRRNGLCHGRGIDGRLSAARRRAELQPARASAKPTAPKTVTIRIIAAFPDFFIMPLPGLCRSIFARNWLTAKRRVQHALALVIILRQNVKRQNKQTSVEETGWQKTGRPRTTAGPSTDGFTGFDPKSVDPYIVKDPEALAMNLARTVEQLGKAASAWLAPRESGEKTDMIADPVVDMVKTLSKVSEYWLSDPTRTLEAQTSPDGQLFLDVDAHAAEDERRGRAPTRTICRATTSASPTPTGSHNPFFDFLRQAYFITSDWADRWCATPKDSTRTPSTRPPFTCGRFQAPCRRPISSTTNPQLYRETVASSGANLVKGMQMLAEDIVAGKGDLKLRQTDTSKFAVGENIAIDAGQGHRAERCLPGPAI